MNSIQVPRSLCSHSDHRLGDVTVNSLRMTGSNLTQWLIGFNNYTRALSALKSVDLKKNDHTRILGLVGLIEF